MSAAKKFSLLLVIVVLGAALTVVAFVSAYHLLQGYYHHAFWFFAIIILLVALQELMRTYWAVIHTQGASVMGAARYLALQSLGMCLVPLLAFIANEIGWSTGFNTARGGSEELIVSLGTGVGAVIGCAIYLWCRRAFPYQTSTNVIRGRTLMSPKDAQRRADEAASPIDARLPWGGIALPENLAEGHFCVVGATGSGKTAAITQLMKAVLPRHGNGAPIRALVYDAKRDSMSILKHIGVPAERIRLLNPFDARSDAWDMAKDINSPATTSQLASILVPKEEGPNRYFSDAARAILAGVMDAFILTNTESWTLRDVVLAMQDHERLKKLLATHPGTSGLIGEYFNRKDTLHDVRSTIASHIALLKPIAALWSRSRRKVSLEEWANGEFILVLGNDDSLRAPLDALNRVLFQRMSEILTRSQNPTSGRTWIFLDELKEAGRLDGLSRLMTKGRTYGVRVVTGFQDLSGLSTVYGDHGAKEIADLPMNKAFLRIDSLPTAQWAADAIGQAEVREYRVSTNASGEQFSEQIYHRQNVLVSELMSLPLPDAHGFHGYFIAPAVGAYRAHVPYGIPKIQADPAFDFHERSPRDQYLDDWGDDDFDRLGVPRAPTPQPTQPPLPFTEPSSEAPEDLMPRLTRDTA